jgi:leader peptidase (prepilin peptidase) / N-methyltransferase
VIILLAFLFGLLLGSFLNVCIHRWPREESVVQPRSRCPECRAPIAWYDNVPLLSYLLLKGKCRRCGAPISMRYPLVELLTALLYAAIVARFGLDPMAFKAALFGSMMLVLFFTDLAEFILPDEITLGGAVLGLALSVFIPVDRGPAALLLLLTNTAAPRWVVSLADAAVSALLLGGFLWLVGEAYYRLRKIDGLGLGDVKMVAMMAAFWGISQTVVILVLSSLVGAVTGILIVIIGRKQWHYALPFGSYLAATGIVVALWGDAILSWYWRQVLPPL